MAVKCELHSGVETELKNLREWQENHIKIDHSYIYETLERVRSRPPVWTTVLISVLTFLLGLAVNVALKRV